VKKDIPRMEMVHHQDVAVELSTRLLTAQHEIETHVWRLRSLFLGTGYDKVPVFK
jgi:hypothetical protein